MRKLLVKGAFLMALFGFGLQMQSLAAEGGGHDRECHHSRGKTTDNVFGYARYTSTTALVCDNMAFSSLSELGSKNYRTNATWGFFCQDQHRFKIGAEYLQQKFHHRFSTGKTEKWSRQWAVGAKYQYLFDQCGDSCSCNPCFCDPCLCNSSWYDWIEGIQVSTAYSRADKHSLRKLDCDYSRVSRNLSGSWFLNGEVGAIMTPWECGKIIVGLGYDYVRYNENIHGSHNKHRHGHKHVSGVGGSIELDQKFCGCYGLHVLTQFKKPYNYFEALVSWTKRTECGDLKLGLFFAHTWGKCNLNSSSAVGAELDFSFGIDGFCNLVCCDPFSILENCCNPCEYSELNDWVSAPAVYMPETLTKTNELIEDF